MYLKMLSIAVDFHLFDVTLNIMRSLNHHDEKLRINLKNGRNNLAAITASTRGKELSGRRGVVGKLL